MKKSISLFLLLIPSIIFAQNSAAYKLGVEGVRAIENGDLKTGVKLLKEAWTKEPASFDYPFEIGKAFLESNDAKKAEKYFYPLQYHSDVQSELYVALAQCYFELNEAKKNPDPERKKELDALRYGIQKLPAAGELYLQLGKRKIELDKPLEALVVFESGITNAPNFCDNYFWAAKLMKASDNHLWTWIYAELFVNMTDNDEMKRTASSLAATASDYVFSDKWVADPEQMDQELKFLVSQTCGTKEQGLERAATIRRCIMQHWNEVNYPISALLERLEQLEQNGFLDVYLGSLMLETNKEKFLQWLAENGEQYEAFRRWRYYNPLLVTEKITRVR